MVILIFKAKAKSFNTSQPHYSIFKNNNKKEVTILHLYNKKKIIHNIAKANNLPHLIL